MRSLPFDYMERVYAGVLGKIIGVYLGRPFEQWSNARIEEKFGEIRRYVAEEAGFPLIVSDDDISGTFTFVRAMEDFGDSLDLTPEQIGWTWLNYIIEDRSILWWGGMGGSTEHTAYLRLKRGIPAPDSGSIALNGRTVAEQIGAQIFIDGWGMLFPNDPELAADFARRAGSVSHDGEAIYGAQVVAAMEAAAFSEKDPHTLINIGLSQIPSDCLIRQMVDDLREWSARSHEWRDTLRRIDDKWGYDKFRGGCHMLPNHAVIMLALLHGKGDFDESMMIVNTAGYDTDCNSANVGCILGIALGLEGIQAKTDWRGPVRDRMYVPTADSGRVVTDAVIETYSLVNIARRMRGEQELAPKGGRRFHFSLPDSIQGFHGSSRVENREGRLDLALEDRKAIQLLTPTWLPEEARNAQGYTTAASPTLYPGQVLQATVGLSPESEGESDVRFCWSRRVGEETVLERGPTTKLAPGEQAELHLPLAHFDSGILTEVGIEVQSTHPSGYLWLDSLGWSGTPTVRLLGEGITNPGREAFVSAVDVAPTWANPLWLSQNEGRGMFLTGTSEWVDYEVEVLLSPNLAKSTGVAVRCQGLRRYVAVELTDRSEFRIRTHWDQEETVLSSVSFPFELNQDYRMIVKVSGRSVFANVNGVSMDAQLDDRHTRGGIALLIEEGRVDVAECSVRPTVL